MARYQGQMTNLADEGQGRYPVSEAVLTETELQIDWIEDGQRSHLRATSSDGISYSGTFGYPQLDEQREVDAKRYEAQDGSVLLLARWLDGIADQDNWSVIELRRESQVSGLTPWGSGVETGAGSLDIVMLDIPLGREFTAAEIIDEVRRRGLPERGAVREHLVNREHRGFISKTANGWKRISD